MTRKRSKEEIQAMILMRGLEPEATVSSMTSLMSLRWRTWLGLKAELIENGMMVQTGKIFQTTEKGIEWLKLREQMLQLKEKMAA